ncbi:dystonin isoform X27 [Anopheles maculipalpis]|uniref:dystonin isoform X27 n=1 Tax=Anopheles maculipalpis TaxID=1496333 RepID=UPI00215925E4|nr:dystonin isoform X27 [Anopheles maculipalpis]
MYKIDDEFRPRGRVFMKAQRENNPAGSSYAVASRSSSRASGSGGRGPAITTNLDDSNLRFRHEILNEKVIEATVTELPDVIDDINRDHWRALPSSLAYGNELVVATPRGTPAGGTVVSEVTRNKRLSTEVLGSTLETTKSSQRAADGHRRMTTHIVRKITTLTRAEEQEQADSMIRQNRDVKTTEIGYMRTGRMDSKRAKISDIVVGQEDNLTAREALLRWARRSTAKYPGVRVNDFTSSWRDGLAFSALIHRNRPDLIDWRESRSRRPRERLEVAFHVVEKEYGVTRLLDPEDVDTNEPDEKSMITYLSSLYDVFPEPPQMHPLFDMDSQRRVQEYREQAQQLLYWCREKTSLLQERAFPTTLIELKRLLTDLNRFRTEEVPPRQRDKQHLFSIYKELEKYFESIGEVDVETELRPEALEKAWHRLMSALADRDMILQQEVQRLERLQKIAEKVQREYKHTETIITKIETRISEESRRIDRLHPVEAKNIVEGLDGDIRHLEQPLQEMNDDCHNLKDGRYPQASDLHKKVTKLHQRWSQLRTTFHTSLVQKLSGLSYPVQETTITKQTRVVTETRQIGTNPYFRDVQEYTEWCQSKLKQLHTSDYGSDLPSAKVELERHQHEHKVIDQFHSKIAQCERHASNFTGEELQLYRQRLSQLQKVYAELLSTSTKRLSDLDALVDFLATATAELSWLNDREQIEVSRDWADKNLDLSAVHRYYENLMSELEKREMHFATILDRGEALLVQSHPASKCIEGHLQALQSQWSWLLQLTLCLEVHLKHATDYHSFFDEVREAENWLTKRDEILNSKYSQSEFTLDQGESLLRGMQDIREELNAFGETIAQLQHQATAIVPLKQRKQPVNRQCTVQSICSYKQGNISLDKNESCTLLDTSGRVKWRVKTSKGVEGSVHGVCLLLPPPDQEAIEAAERLKRLFDRSVALWQKKQLRLRQNMIFATIKVVKGWDFEQFLAMGAEQRTAIRRALNDDADKLLAEGDPADPQLRRLRREMDEVNRLFDEFEKRARAEEESKQASRIFTEQCISLKTRLEEMARELDHIILSPMPRDLDSLEHTVQILEDYKRRLGGLEPDLKHLQETFRTITLKTPALKKSLDNLMDLWKELNTQAGLHGDRLKLLEGALAGLEDNEQVISDLESKLSRQLELPSSQEGLYEVYKRLTAIQETISSQQPEMDKMNDSADQLGRMGVPTKVLGDLKRLHSNVERLNSRWNNICGQLAERMRSVETAIGLMKNLQTSIVVEETWVEKQTEKLQALPTATSARELDQAVIEKFALCEDHLAKLLEWITRVEQDIAAVGGPKERVDDLRNQINSLKQIKEDIDGQSRPVASCLDQVRQLVLTGGDVLSAPEVAALETSGRELRARVDKAQDRTGKLLRRLGAARDELGKLRTELDTFSSWLQSSRRTLEDKESTLSDLNNLPSQSDSVKEFHSDVIAHQADLRFITMSAQKFVDECKDYLGVLNDFRTTLPDRLPHIEQISSSDSPIRQEVSLVTAQYRDLLNRANALLDRLAGLGNRQRDYQDSLEKVRSWLRDVQPRVSNVLSDPIAADPQSVQDQMNQTKALQSEFLSQGRLLDNVQHCLDALLKSLAGRLSPSEVSALEIPVEEVKDKYTQLLEALGDRSKLLDTALVQSQGVQDALDGLAVWINQSEEKFKLQNRPASLIKDRLNEQVREHRGLLNDLESHRTSLESVTLSAQELMATPSNTRLAKRIESNLSDVTGRFEKLLDKALKRGEFLEDTLSQLSKFLNDSSNLEQELTALNDALEGRELVSLPAEVLAQRMVELSRLKEDLRPQYEATVRLGKDLIAKRDVTDTGVVRDLVKVLESLWKTMDTKLDEKLKLSKQKAEQLHAYENLKDQVLVWLSSIETRTNNLAPVAVDVDAIKYQIEEVRPLVKEHREYGVTIDRVNDLGAQYDALIRPDSPTRKRSVYSPIKRSNVSPMRRLSGDARSPSPTKGGPSPLSPASGSSGFGSRRSSQDGFQLTDLTPIQQQLTEINNRYSLVGARLNDRQNELDSVRDEVRKHQDNLKTLASFLDKIHRQVPRDVIGNKEEADRCNKQARKILEEMYERQSLLDSTKAQVKDLLKRKPDVQGAERLRTELDAVADRWKNLNDLCKDRITFSEYLRDFLDTHDNLNTWLAAKERMLTVLGPISSDPRMVQSQVQQVQVLREEFRGQQPQLNHLQEVGNAVLEQLRESSPEGQAVSTKLRNLQKKWDDLVARLDERAQSLGAAADSSKEFDAGLNRLREALQTISDNLDSLPTDRDHQETLRKIENLERQLEGQRPLLADSEAAAETLCRVLSDPVSRADVNARVTAVGKQYQTLQKKLDMRKAETDAALRDGRQFAETCAKTLGWLSGELGNLTDRLLVSAHRPTLQHQIDTHEPVYREVMGREHEVIMLLNKGRDLQDKPGQTTDRGMQRDLEKIAQQWDRLRSAAVDRHSRLQTCMEHCKKHAAASEAFLSWLRSAEDKLALLKPGLLKKQQLDQQLRDLQTFRSDVWKRSGEYETCRSLGETFIGACDVDKEAIKAELQDMKDRWERLNNELLARAQTLETCAKRLGDFNEELRDLDHAVGRCEDRLAAHDALGGAAKDPKLLERVRAIKDDATALRKPLQSVRKLAGEIAGEARAAGGDADHLKSEVDGISDRIEDLHARLDDRCGELQSAATAVSQFNDKVKLLGVDLNDLEQQVDSLHPPAREIKVVLNQLDEVSGIINKIDRVAAHVSEVERAGEQLVDCGFAPDTAQTRDQIGTLRKQLGRLDNRARDHDDALQRALKALEKFYDLHQHTQEDLGEVGDQLKKMKPVSSELEQIRHQQDDLRRFRQRVVEPLTGKIDELNRLGQDLIRSAQGGVPTTALEKDLEKINDRWNDLKEKLNERERRLDVGLLQSGKFQEALDGLSEWLKVTEEMVANQKPPSADYKVVKAQLADQPFLMKMLSDRQETMASLFELGQEVAAGCDASEKAAIERQLKELMRRLDDLTDAAQRRTHDLEQAMHVAKQFQDQLIPLTKWLDGAERAVKAMELVPTDEEKIQARIREHEQLHDEILSKKPDFTELADIAAQLMELVGDDEAVTLSEKVKNTTDRYTDLVVASENIGHVLNESRQGLRHLVLTYQDLVSWMEKTENKLQRFKIIPVHTEKLLEQMDALVVLNEEIASRSPNVESTVEAGSELMKHISSDEALQLKDKLDSLQRRYGELTTKGGDLLKHAQDALPLVQQFHDSHARLVSWMQAAESALATGDANENDIARLEAELTENRQLLEQVNSIGPQLCQISPGEGASTIEGIVTRDNRRFEAIVEQIQRKAERLHLSKQRSNEVTADIDELLEWFRDMDATLRDADPPAMTPKLVRTQLQEHRSINDDISSQKGRVRDVTAAAKKVLRESQPNDNTIALREKLEDLKEVVETVAALCSNRLSVLEQALPLSEHFADSHTGLATWLNDMEHQISMLSMPALRPDQIAIQQDKNERLTQSITEHKPLLDKLNKTGEALMALVADEDAAKIGEILDSDNARYAALRTELRDRQNALDQALQESSQFSDKLEGMLRALQNTAEQANQADPISAHPPKIHDQIDENVALVQDIDKRGEAFAAVQRAASDVISKATNQSDPAVRDIKKKLDKLNALWGDLQKTTSKRGAALNDTLAVAEKFWKEMQAVMETLKELQEALQTQEPPAAQPQAIQKQQVALQEIRQEIDQTKPEVEQVRRTGSNLMSLCGEPDKPEVKKHIEDLDNAWDNITALYAKREENLIDAMEKAMEFHETLQNLLNFLARAEDRFQKLGPLGSDIEAVKKQIEQLKHFKDDVDPHMVEVEALNRQAVELTERTSAEQAGAIREPLNAVNRRWESLLRGMVERQKQLEHALLHLGQFQHALNELLVWINKTDANLDELKPIPGDPQLLEVELAKLKVLANDIHAHQSSVDTLNDAGRKLIENDRGSLEASTTQDKLQQLNKQWRDLLQKAADRQHELEESLREAQAFTAEIQDLLGWLGDVDAVISASKPVGGLPETASEQLERFMEVYNELEENRAKVETLIAQGQEYVRKQSQLQVSSSNLQHTLRTLKQRWDAVVSRASDKKIKLEIALKEATEFHDALQAFVEWLTQAEKQLSSASAVSRVLETIQQQMEEHKVLQKDVSIHRESMLLLDKKGTHLKYFSQKQDVILIKNLLVSVQHRWERVVAKAAERTRALDHGYKEAREFHDAWVQLTGWLKDTEKTLDTLAEETSNDAVKIKKHLEKLREIQRNLQSKESFYDSTMRNGKGLMDRAPKSDETVLSKMMSELKDSWKRVCQKSVERQRKFEEALLLSGQFADALQALLDWLRKTKARLAEDGPVHGDLDTVTTLVEHHRQLESDLDKRSAQMQSVMKTGLELERSDESRETSKNLKEMQRLWDDVQDLSSRRKSRLDVALKEAERLHKSVHMLLEWLSEAEQKLRFAAAAPDDESQAKDLLDIHAKFMKELREKEYDKEDTIGLANSILGKAHPDAIPIIKNWISIIQSRWDEISQWAISRQTKLEQHLKDLQDLDESIEELLAWLAGLEATLLNLDAEPLPDEIPPLEVLIADHKEFMENTARRQGEVDRACKPRQPPPGLKETRKPSRGVLKTPIFKGSRDQGLNSRRTSRVSPGRETQTPERDRLPHYGPRFTQSNQADTELRSPRAKLLWEKWRYVWLLAWERQRRLHDHMLYLQDVERVRQFSWEEWRKRFLKFMNHKKSRLTDLFRKMDKDNNGLIPREVFIDGIIGTKFDTSKLEMGAVADLFDRNGEGLIDWQEFIAALRPDWQDRKPKTEADKIHDEVKRLVMLCTCRQKFRVFQVGEGKYRFGDSQKLRLVRILRSTVMVRVGGGWVALDEFLVKNDPCRADEHLAELMPIFEQLRAQGNLPCTYPLHVTSSGTAFIRGGSRSTPLSPHAPHCHPSTHWVRERSAKSISMSRPSRSSLSASTPDSLSDNESGIGTPGRFQTPSRKSSVPVSRSQMTPGGSRANSRPSSRPASRAGSKPPSRHGSTLSLDSTDDATPSRIPTRRLTQTSTPRPSRLSVGSVSGRTGTTTTTTTNGVSSRTASGAASPAPTRNGGMSRSSSIPTLIGLPNSSQPRSRIPVRQTSNVSNSSSATGKTSGASTPSGMQTPRRTSVEPGTPGSTIPARPESRNSRGATPSEKRAPFRL